MKGIYEFNRDFYRMGVVESIFIADEKEVEALIGKDIYFGEILGKHSEVYFTIEEKDITLKTQDYNVIKIVSELGILPTGYNPLHYFTCEDCGDVVDIVNHKKNEDDYPICDDCHKEYHSENRSARG